MSLPGFTANACLYRTTNHYRGSLGNVPLTESDVRNLHRLAMQRARSDIAGQYAKVHRYVRTERGRHTFPSPTEVPTLMRGFARWLGSAPNTPETAFAAHRHLVDIHPFRDGNGRTARLLMNSILIRGGYPPIVVRPEDRPSYLRALEQSQAGRGTEAFDTLLFDRLKAEMDLKGYWKSLISCLPDRSREWSQQFDRENPAQGSGT
jgi:Fic family protein